MICAGALAVAMLAHAAPAAHAAVATLDPSFGDAGLLKLPTEGGHAEPGAAALGAAGPDGSLVVSSGESLQLVSPTGGTGEVFGGIGSLTVPEAAPRTFALGGFTVDRQGRLLVVGSSLYPEDENPSPVGEGLNPVFEPAALRVLRFLPDGGLDPTFGQGGVVETDLGLPPPRGRDGRPIGSFPALHASGVAVDPQGRIYVTGTSVIHLGPACRRNSYPPGVFLAGLVLRLGEDGALDPTFGRGGVAGGRRLDELPLAPEAIEEPVVGPAGTLTYRSSAVDPCSRSTSHLGIGQLTASGRARDAFGKRGALVGEYRALAGGPDGSVVALSELPETRGGEVRGRVQKFSSDGRPDASFGQDGSATLALGHVSEPFFSSITVDDEGRVIIGGVAGTGQKRSIVLLRVNVRGGRQIHFGPKGKVTTRAPGLNGPSTLFFDPQGRLVSVEPYDYAAKERSGLFVARYLLGN